MHSTNYFNSFIEIAEDSDLQKAKTPQIKNEKPSIAQMQYTRIAPNPYQFTSDDVIFEIWAERNNVEVSEDQRLRFFSKGQPCLRTSPLAKSHGFGFHFDDQARVALYPVESLEYSRFVSDPDIKHVKAMRTKRA